MLRTVLTICAVLGVSLILSGEMDWVSRPYALAMGIVDTLAAVVVLIRPAGKAQAMVGFTLLLQVMVYVARYATDYPDYDRYWWHLSILAFLQLIVLGGWIVYELAGGRGTVPWFVRAHSPAHRQSVD